MKEVAFEINGIIFVAKMSRKDRAWGHGVDVKLEAKCHSTLNCSFICHPEYEGYQVCQLQSTEQLLSLTEARLREGAAEVVINPGNAGLRVLFCLNGPTKLPMN